MNENNKVFKPDFEKEIATSRSTKGFLQISRQFSDLVNSKEFQSTVKQVRNLHSVVVGSEVPDEKEFFYIHSTHFTNNEGELEPYDEPIRDAAEFICVDFGLNIDDYILTIIYYIRTNKIAFPKWVGHWSPCKVQDEYEKHTEPEYDPNFDKEDDSRYPISIRISPEASKREIINFVEKSFSTRIKPLQEIYKKNYTTPKTRTRPAGKRNLYITENYNSMAKDELLKNVKEKYPREKRIITNIDLGQINYSERNKRRKR